ncbi:hypothetical protein [Kitasatospora sp. SolWspMP-SS2h]|uniref:hypothetical protein n=1 Tax=Kitasatospora sp. SolWspMP-SS2h TaxID=1305729 RepID=UPI0011B939D2
MGAATGPAAGPDGRWEPAPGTAVRGTVVLLPGRGEHPGVYARFGRRLASDGYRLLVPATDTAADRHPDTDPPRRRHGSDALPAPDPLDRPGPRTPTGPAAATSGSPASAAAPTTGTATGPGSGTSPAPDPLDQLDPLDALDLTGLLDPADPAAPSDPFAPGAPSGRPAALFAQARAEQPAGGPVVLAGSDLGALLALGLAAEVRPDGLLLAGLPGGGRPVRAEDELSARTACPVHRGLLAGDPGFRPGALFEPVPAALAGAAAAARPAVPVLAFHGSADPVAPVGALRELAGRLPSVEAVTVADGRHDVFNDAVHRSVAARTVLWLEQLRAGLDLLPSAPPPLLVPLGPPVPGTTG